MLKNPWSHLRWKGSFSENDTVHWTEEMKRLLNYNPSDAAMFDNGITSRFVILDELPVVNSITVTSEDSDVWTSLLVMLFCVTN